MASEKANDELCKHYPSAIFIFGSQTTTSGHVRGGSSAGFDCSVEIIVQKSPDGDFKKNTAYLEKNWYAFIVKQYSTN